jgi:TetR/AcrR family transcriptional regulator, transcriptional repressor of bet genes
LPKQGMGPIRREQICRAASAVISEHGFSGTTMRLVSEKAGVSTGMLNHYFPNRMNMLEETLIFVSRRMQAREAAIIDAAEPGEQRLRALIRGLLPTTPEIIESWRVWIAAYGASVSRERLRAIIGTRNTLWYDVLARTVEGLVPPTADLAIPFVWELDALINGLVIQALASQSELDFEGIEETIVRAVKRAGGRSAVPTLGAAIAPA